MHNEYIKIAENADTAVLMVHGIAGSPRHFDDIAPLIPKDWSIYNILLDGHGKGVKEFGKSSMKKWKHQVDNLMSQLYEKYNNIYLVGHSMGTLLLLNISHKYADKIRAMILLAVPLRVFLKPASFTNSIKLVLHIETTPADAVSRKVHGVKHDAWLWHYIRWIPRYFELFKLMSDIRKNIENVNVKCYTFQSGKDELVSLRSLKYLRKNKMFEINVLEKSMHFYYEDEDYKYLQKRVEQILSE